MMLWLKKLFGFHKETEPLRTVWPMPKTTHRVTVTGRRVSDFPEIQELRPRKPWQPPSPTALPAPLGISGPMLPVQSKPTRPRESSTTSQQLPDPIPTPAPTWAPNSPTLAPAPYDGGGGGFSGSGASSSWESPSPSPSPSSDSSSSDSSSSSSD